MGSLFKLRILSTLKKHQQYIKGCKDATWTRWQTKNLRSLRKYHNMKQGTRDMEKSIGDAVLIKVQENKKGKCNIRILEELNKGKDGVNKLSS